MSQRGEHGGARLLDGRAIAREMLGETARGLADLTASSGAVAQVRVVLVGGDAASAIYARRILDTATSVGAAGRLIALAEDADAANVRGTLEELSGDPDVTGVIVQLPLPPHLDISDVIGALDPAKDLDGIHPVNAGLVSRGGHAFAPSCAEAALQILKRSAIPLAGRPTVVIGRSNVVGKPAALLLIREHATVTVCHRQTRELEARIREAEVVVVAAGSPRLVRGHAVAPGAVVIDCGINVLSDGSVVGDVDLPTVRPVAGAVTSVPGGVGPVTNAVLMEHLARAARARHTAVAALPAPPSPPTPPPSALVPS
jgi:methylenetetrahydrofolate dehydrogenase (NADP+)/methenyltetrahydrofolate cyclohydrolase